MLEYDGTRYSGWQSQTNSVAIQDVVERAIKALTGEALRVVGASRTDAGVHAAGQVANFKTASELPLANIKNGLNKKLPDDITVTRTEEVSLSFHSQHDARRKHYRYTLTTKRPVSPFVRNFVATTPYTLDAGVMRAEAKAFLGRHDFASFQNANSRREETVRHVYRADVRKSGAFIYFDMEADGFLYNMARSIVGTLIEVGRRYLPKGSVKRILKGADRRLAGMTAPAKGLSLIEVTY